MHFLKGPTNLLTSSLPLLSYLALHWISIYFIYNSSDVAKNPLFHTFCQILLLFAHGYMHFGRKLQLDTECVYLIYALRSNRSEDAYMHVLHEQTTKGFGKMNTCISRFLIHSSSKETQLFWTHFSRWPWVTDPDSGSCTFCQMVLRVTCKKPRCDIPDIS